MRNFITALLGIIVFGATPSFAEEQPNLTAVIVLSSGNGRYFYNTAVDLTALKQDNMYECRRQEDSFYYKDKRNNYVYMVRIARTGNGVLKIWGGSLQEEGKGALETSFIGTLAMPTTQSFEYTSFYSSSPVFYIITVRVYLTGSQPDKKNILGGSNELPCTLKAKDDITKGYLK